jgi:hypothetical protein
MKKLCLFMSVCMLLAGGLSAAIKKGPYMIYANNASAMTVLWQTDAAQTCTLQWGTDTSYSGGSVSSTEINTSHQHKKTISGLAANTMYYYKVIIGSSSYTGSFRSAPASSATSVKFLVYGDTRSNDDLHDKVASRMVSTLTSDSGYQTLALHVGDFCEDGESESLWTSDFFPRSRASILSLQSKVAIQGVRGNHEGNGTLFKRYFPYPFAADGGWSFDYGPVHVCAVDQCVISRSDSGFNLSSTQFNWLTNDLARTSKKWKVIVVHHPGYSSGGSHPDNTYLINTLRPQFEKYDVTAVFGGHNHYYARALRNKIHYVTTGGGGASSSSSPGTASSYVVVKKSGLQFCKVAISGDTFNCKSVAAETGSIIDDFTVTKSGGTPTASCHIDEPAGNVTVSPGASLLVKVSASDSDGVERVKLFSGTTELISDSSAPYELTLTNLTASFTLTAKVKDLLGNYTDSDNSRTITVSGGTTTTVPWVTNMTVAAAGTSITNAGLVVGSVSQEHHATVPAGRIFSQTPGGGTTVNRGTAVNLAESLGPSSGTTVTFYSVGVHDGYVDESSETSNVGGTNNATLTTGTALRVGDTGARKQRKSIVSFDTSTLPDAAVVTAATLKLKRGGGLGDSSGFGNLTVDIKNVSVGFGTSLNLENMDFEYAASKSDVGTLNYPAATNAWAIAALNTNGTARIAKTNHTQFRIRFVTDDDNDSVDDYLGFYSGENATVADRPILEVTYQ